MTIVKSNTHKKAHCKNCRLVSFCLPYSMNVEDIDVLNDIVQRSSPLKKGDFLFRQGDAFNSVYAIRSGALKTSILSANGELHINGFRLPGELVGFSGMDIDTYPLSAQAQTTTSICEIPFVRLDELSARLPQLRRQFMHAMSREIREDQNMMFLLSKNTADERLATFLINLSARLGARGYSFHQFHLSMSRSEIGNYLGLATETVCRVFSRFQQIGLIEAEGKYVRILDRTQLCAWSNGGQDMELKSPLLPS